MWHQHMNGSKSSQAILFATTDAPLLDKLGFYREEPEVSVGSRPYPAVPADLAVRARGGPS
jgi:hypothetical protein